jgi:nucleotide-binding universal stress UspA family protein
MVELSARMGTNAPAGCSHSCIAPAVTGRDHQVTPKRKVVTPMRSSIIVGVDGSREATDAARVAASLARGLHRRLVLAHVVAGPPFHADRWQREVQRRRAIRRGTDLLEGVATEIGEPTARRRIALTGLIEGDLEDRLAALTREEDADLVVVGSRARGALVSTLLGSVSASRANNGAYPVVVVPPAWGRRFADGRRTWSGSIVCGIDGSADSDRPRIVAEKLPTRSGFGCSRSTSTRSAGGATPRMARTSRSASRLPPSPRDCRDARPSWSLWARAAAGRGSTRSRAAWRRRPPCRSSSYRRRGGCRASRPPPWSRQGPHSSGRPAAAGHPPTIGCRLRCQRTRPARP